LTGKKDWQPDTKHKDNNENRTRKNNRGNIDDSFISDGQHDGLS
jgi:hypothetical protein